MKVNYDPKYTSPHSHKPYQSLHVRLTVAKDIYSHGGKNKKKEPTDDASKSKVFTKNTDRIQPIDDNTAPQDTKTSHSTRKADTKRSKGYNKQVVIWKTM